MKIIEIKIRTQIIQKKFLFKKIMVLQSMKNNLLKKNKFKNS